MAEVGEPRTYSSEVQQLSTILKVEDVHIEKRISSLRHSSRSFSCFGKAKIAQRRSARSTHARDDLQPLTRNEHMVPQPSDRFSDVFVGDLLILDGRKKVGFGLDFGVDDAGHVGMD